MLVGLVVFGCCFVVSRKFLALSGARGGDDLMDSYPSDQVSVRSMASPTAARR
jgi:hypothetical protein